MVYYTTAGAKGNPDACSNFVLDNLRYIDILNEYRKTGVIAYPDLEKDAFVRWAQQA